MGQTKGPIEVVSDDSSWTKTGGATTIDCVGGDPLSHSDASFVDEPDGLAMQFKIDVLDHPNRTDAHFVGARLCGPSKDIPFILALVYDGTDVQVEGFTATSSFDDYEFELSDSAAAAIVDYAQVHVEIRPDVDGLRLATVWCRTPDRTLRAYVIG